MKNDDKKEGEQTDLLEAIETDAAGKTPADKKAAEASAADDDTDDKSATDNEAEDGDDSRLSADAENVNEDQLVNERRLRRKIQKEMKREARANERRELAELRRQNEELLNRMRNLEVTQTGTTETTLKTNLRHAVDVYNEATEELRLAVEAGDGKRHIEALEKRDRAKETAQALDIQIRRLNAARQEPANLGPDPQETRLYQDWISKNTWFDTSLGNEESKMARVVNDALLAEGYKPNTPAFWNELSSRVERFVKPARTNKRTNNADDADDENTPPPARRGGPPVAGSGREGAAGNSNKVYISPERKQAMIEAGAWHDETLRQKYLRAYAKFDRENQTQRAN